jgi:hypothetical protein
MSNVCQCPNPPGGTVQCSDDQLAICSYTNGEIVSGCYDRPEPVAAISDKRERNLALANWVLSRITGIARPIDEAIEASLVELLRSGSYTDPQTDQVIRFTLPRDLELDFPQAAAAAY